MENCPWSAPPTIAQPVTSSPGSVSLAASRLTRAWFSLTLSVPPVVICGAVLGASVVLVTGRLLSACASLPTSSRIGLVPGV